MIMRLLLFSLTAFLSTIADPAANDADDLIFPIGTQTFNGDFPWNDPDVNIGFATDDLGFEVSGDDNPGLFDEGSNGDYFNYEDNYSVSIMEDIEQPRFGLESICSTNEGPVTGKVRRENECPGK